MYQFFLTHPVYDAKTHFGSRYKTPLTAEEERILIASTIPKNTGYKQNGP
jgi:hypothetical protein